MKGCVPTISAVMSVVDRCVTAHTHTHTHTGHWLSDSCSTLRKDCSCHVFVVPLDGAIVLSVPVTGNGWWRGGRGEAGGITQPCLVTGGVDKMLPHARPFYNVDQVSVEFSQRQQNRMTYLIKNKFRTAISRKSWHPGNLERKNTTCVPVHTLGCGGQDFLLQLVIY